MSSQEKTNSTPTEHPQVRPAPARPVYRDYAHKLAAAEALYWSARELKAAYMKSCHPEWSDQIIHEKVKRWMMYASS